MYCPHCESKKTRKITHKTQLGYKQYRCKCCNKQYNERTDVMKGFKDIFSALVFCTAFVEIRQFFRMKNKTRAERRGMIASIICQFQNLFLLTA